MFDFWDSRREIDFGILIFIKYFGINYLIIFAIMLFSFLKSSIDIFNYLPPKMNKAIILKLKYPKR